MILENVLLWRTHHVTNRNSLDGGTNESQVTTVRLSFKSSTQLQQHVADLQRRDFFFRKSCINLQFSANTMLSAAEFLLLLDSWGCGVIYIPLRPVDFCINLIKTRVGVHSSLGPVFNVNMNHVVVCLILSDDSRSVSPDTSPPKVHHISRPVFPPEVLFLLVFKNLKGSFIFQQSLVFDWVPVRQSLYFFFSWMDSRFILSPSNFVVGLWSVFKPNPSLNAARHTNLSSDTPVAADGVCSSRGGRDFFWSLSEV